MYRDCEIRNCLDRIGHKVKLAGWVETKRDHGKLAFIDLRDHTGIIQLVFNESFDISKISTESVISVFGTITFRDEGQINPNLLTGKIELFVEKIDLISKSDVLPFEVNNEKISEELKLKYRTLYLRGNKMQRNLKFRSQVIQFLRNYMIEREFLEVQTPLITASSPEGARDFVIPSRLHPGKFYALPQAPQVFKQLLMASSVPRYFQIAPCFRDEDARKDRCYGEFYQLDVEMSFVEQEDILKILSGVATSLIKKFCGVEPKLSRIKYKESMNIYGSDKPDLRNPLVLEDFSDIFIKSEMDFFRRQVENGAIVKGIRVNKDFGKNELNNSLCKSILENIEKDHHFKIAYVIKTENELKGPIAKFLDTNILQNDEVIFFVCDKHDDCCKKLDILRNYLPKILDFYMDPMDFQLVEVVDFPMFERDDKSETGWAFKHNPFSKPKNLDENNMELVEADQYDLVLNGIEICSGSVRNTDVDLLIRCFGLVGINESEVREKFNSMISGFAYGVPPHGGFAIGIDRIIMILLNEENVREVVAFPLNTNGYDPLTRTPNEISISIKKELKLI